MESLDFKFIKVIKRMAPLLYTIMMRLANKHSNLKSMAESKHRI